MRRRCEGPGRAARKGKGGFVAELWRRLLGHSGPELKASVPELDVLEDSEGVGDEDSRGDVGEDAGWAISNAPSQGACIIKGPGPLTLSRPSKVRRPARGSRGMSFHPTLKEGVDPSREAVSRSWDGPAAWQGGATPSFHKDSGSSEGVARSREGRAPSPDREPRTATPWPTCSPSVSRSPLPRWHHSSPASARAWPGWQGGACSPAWRSRTPRA